MYMPYKDKKLVEDEITKDIIHTKEQNQASKEGANLSGGGCVVHPHKKREEELKLIPGTH